MKTVQFNFETDEQAERFFDIFSDVPDIEDCENSDARTKAVNVIMENCEAESVSTIKEDAAYVINVY